MPHIVLTYEHTVYGHHTLISKQYCTERPHIKVSTHSLLLFLWFFSRISTHIKFGLLKKQLIKGICDHVSFVAVAEVASVILTR